MAKKLQQKPTYACKDCRNARDFHEKNYNGEFFMCKCDYKKRSMFLNRDYCDKFVKK